MSTEASDILDSISDETLAGGFEYLVQGVGQPTLYYAMSRFFLGKYVLVLASLGFMLDFFFAWSIYGAETVCGAATCVSLQRAGIYQWHELASAGYVWTGVLFAACVWTFWDVPPKRDGVKKETWERGVQVNKTIAFHDGIIAGALFCGRLFFSFYLIARDNAFSGRDGWFYSATLLPAIAVFLWLCGHIMRASTPQSIARTVGVGKIKKGGASPSEKRSLTMGTENY